MHLTCPGRFHPDLTWQRPRRDSRVPDVKALISLFAALVLLALPRPAAAQGQDALQAYSTGNYDKALAAAAAAGNADSDAFSARVLLAKALSSEQGLSSDLLSKALAEANAALSLEPDHVEARMQKAIALSLMARLMDNAEARKSGFGGEARDLAEGVLTADPENAYAHAFLAVWHVEVLRRGGTLGAMVMGASLRDARRHYEAASASAPDDASIHWQWARALAALDAKKYRPEIEAALAAARAAHTDDALEAVMQARAAELAGLLARDGPKAAEVHALEML